MSVVIEVETVEIVVQNETVLNPVVVEVGDAAVPMPQRLEDETAPKLGGDLQLNNHTILGLLDCGLLG